MGLLEKEGGAPGSRWVCHVPESHVDRSTFDISSVSRGRGGIVSLGLVGSSCQSFARFRQTAVSLCRVFFLNVPLDSILERMTLRRTDPVTGERLVRPYWWLVMEGCWWPGPLQSHLSAKVLSAMWTCFRIALATMDRG